MHFRNEGDVMKMLIKVVKRSDAIKQSETPAKPKITTEMIVKSWVIESREQRLADMDRLHKFVSWTTGEGTARG
jgi:hypothetical protein